MAEIVNDRDVLLQAASVRKLTTAGVAVVPTPSSYNFYLRADGSHGPDYVRISVATILCDGPFTFAVQGAAKLSNVTATTADIAFADMTSLLAIVTVTAANAGTPVQGSCVVGVVSDGQAGQGGARGAGMYYATGGAWSNSVAAAACPGGVPIAGDVVCISNSTTYTLTKKYDGSTWAPLGGVYDGSLFVTGSILASALDTRGIVVRDLQGNPIVGVGQPLQAAYFGATVGGDNLCPNSSFEVASNGVMADGWGIYNNNASGEPATSSIEAGRLGGKALAISWTPSHVSEKGIMRSGAVPQWVPNATYIISFYARTSNLTSTSNMVPRWNVQPTSTVALMNPNLSTAWQRYAFKITWGSSVETVGSVYLSIASGSGGGNVHFDDLMIVEGDVLPAYYPSAAEALAAANAATAAITAISSDNILSKGEKLATRKEYETINAEAAVLIPQAANLGVDSYAYSVAFQALSSYLVSLGTSSSDWYDASKDTPIDGAVFRKKFTDCYNTKQALISAMDAKASTTSTWAGTVGPGKPADNATSDVALYVQGSMTLTGNKAAKNAGSGNAWDSSVYTLNGYAGGAYAEARMDIVGDLMFGLNSDPTTDSWYGSIDYAIYTTSDGLLRAYSNGTPLNGNNSIGNYAAGDVLGVKFDGSNVFFCKNGVSLWSVATSDGNVLYLDSSFYVAGTSLSNIRFGPLTNNSAGTAAYNALPGINSALASKLSAGTRNVLAGGAGITAGTLTWDGSGNYTGGYGVAINNRGIVAYNTSGSNTFYLSASDGTAAFAGTIYAQAGTIGGLTLANGALCNGYYGGWDWTAKAPGPGFLIHPNGMLFGDPNDANYGYVQIGANGYLSMPGFTYSGRQLTLSSPILVNPKTQTSFSASIATVRITNQTPNVRVTTGIGVSLSGGSGASGYSYQWVFNSDTGGGSNAINATGLLSNPSLSITAQCSAGWYYASASVTVTDIATRATATASVRISIQFGSGAET